MKNVVSAFSFQLLYSSKDSCCLVDKRDIKKNLWSGWVRCALLVYNEHTKLCYLYGHSCIDTKLSTFITPSWRFPALAIEHFSNSQFFFSLPCTVCTTLLNNGSLNSHNRKDCQALTQYIFAGNSYSGKYTQWEIRFGRSFNSSPRGSSTLPGHFFSLILSDFIYLFLSRKAHISPQRLCSAFRGLTTSFEYFQAPS